MKKSRHSVFWFVAMLLLTAGCVQPVEINPPAEREVFVRCVLMNDTVQTVILLYSGGIGEERFEPVTDAEVYIDSPDHVKIRFFPKGDGIWESDFQPKAGDTYTLNVKIPDREPISATTTFPRSFTVISHVYVPARWVSDMLQHYRNNGYHHNLISEWLGVFRQEIPGDPPMWDYSVLDRMEDFHGTTMHQAMPGMPFRIEAEEDIVLYVLGTKTDNAGNVTWMEQLGSNHKGLDLSNSLQVGFHPTGVSQEETPLNLEPKMGKGYDYFLNNPENRKRYADATLLAYEGMPICRSFLRIEHPRTYDNGERIYTVTYEFLRNGKGIPESVGEEDPSATVSPPYGFPAEDYQISYHLSLLPVARAFFSIYGDFSFNIWDTQAPPGNPVLYFCSVSEEYDKYLKSIQAVIADTEGDILTSLYGEAGGYSNIRGGCGVFGAASVLRHNCQMRDASGTTPFNPNPILWYGTYPAYPAPLPSL